MTNDRRELAPSPAAERIAAEADPEEVDGDSVASASDRRRSISSMSALAFAAINSTLKKIGKNNYRFSGKKANLW